MAKKPNAGVGGSVSKEDLIGLMAACTQTGSQIGEARGHLSKKFSVLEERGFNAKVFKAIRSLTNGKNAAGVAGTIRCFNEYVELMGLNDQGDIEDFLKTQPDVRTATEKAMDGELSPQQRADADRAAKGAAKPRGKGKGKGDVKGAAGKMTPEDALDMLRKTLKEADNADAVNTGLERFQEDHPEIEGDEAIEIASERLAELAEA